MPLPGTEDQRALDRARNVAWLHGLDRAFARLRTAEPIGVWTTLEKQIARELGEKFPTLDEGTRSFARYQRGDRILTPPTLDRYEAVFAGTREIFDSGPYGSHLWSAITSTDAESARTLRDSICDDIRTGVRIEHRVTVLGHSGVQDALVPASLARQLGICGYDLPRATEVVAHRLTRDPDLVHRLAAVTGAFAADSAGALIEVNPGVTYSSDERVRSLPVTAPVLSGFSLEILNARILQKHAEPLLIVRQREIDTHLARFGLSIDTVGQLTGLSFLRLHPVVLSKVVVNFVETSCGGA
jgi:hypothetical protein